jgi:hypothetical protein
MLTAGEPDRRVRLNLTAPEGVRLDAARAALLAPLRERAGNGDGSTSRPQRAAAEAHVAATRSPSRQGGVAQRRPLEAASTRLRIAAGVRIVRNFRSLAAPMHVRSALLAITLAHCAAHQRSAASPAERPPFVGAIARDARVPGLAPSAALEAPPRVALSLFVSRGATIATPAASTANNNGMTTGYGFRMSSIGH